MISARALFACEYAARAARPTAMFLVRAISGAHGEEVERTGRWAVGASFQYHLDKNLTAGLVQFFQHQQRRGGHSVSVLDIGAGSGRYVDALRGAGIDASGIDGPSAARLSGGLVRGHDLTEPIEPCKQHTWVISLEVAEHIPPEHEDMFLRNINCSVGLGLVLSWAPPGQVGSGHVNMRDRLSVIERLAAFSLHVDEVLSGLLASQADMRWFRGNLLVFWRAGRHTHRRLLWHQMITGPPGTLPPAASLMRAPAAMRHGYCNATISKARSSCGRHMEGSLPMSPFTGIRDARACVEHCLHRCTRCRYVSMSAAYDDCSWHFDCDMSALHTGTIVGESPGSADTFVTIRVKY